MAQTPPTTENEKSLLSILLSKGFLTKEQTTSFPPNLDQISLDNYLLGQHLVNADDLLQAYAALYKIPFVRLKTSQIKSDVLLIIPEMTARRYDIVAYDREGDIVNVALASPNRLREGQKNGILHQLQDQLGLKIAPAFAPLADIRASHQLYQLLAQQAKDQVAGQKDERERQTAEQQQTIVPNLIFPPVVLRDITIAP